MNRDQDKLLIH